MATVASLQTELRSLGSSSKRHNPELSHSSDKSTSVLEAASQSFDNDNSIIASLRKYDDFVTPFILACKEASAKSCASALQCIQILATYKAIAPSRLGELLGALMEATQLGLGIQLKILQVLPVLLFEFSADLSGDLVVELLQVCSELLGTNKVATVHNAAYATLQQLITGVFDRTSIPEDVGVVEPKKTITIDSGEVISYEVPRRLYDSAMIWSDLCDIAEKIPPKFLKIKDLPLTFTLELLELTFANQAALIHKHKELAAILRQRVTPLLLRQFSEVSDFPVVLRVVRIFYLLLRQHLDILTTESEVILSTLAQGSLHGPIWKRVTCLEVLQGVLLEVDLLFQIYSKFDGEHGRLNVIETIATDFASTMTQDKSLLLASEIDQVLYDRAISPANKSTSSVSSFDTSSESNANDQGDLLDPSMVLNKNSATATPVIEMLDRTEPPKIKRGHPYYLIIKCINSLSDDLHRLASIGVSDVAVLLKSLGTPLLKCFSIGLSLAMDLELFRLVVRAVQRLAHASGIASARNLRDEFITLLAQYCYIPEDGNAKPWLLGRCSLCVRALFNLGYALGNQLDNSWSLIVGAITVLSQQIDVNESRTIETLFGNNSAEYRNMNAALKKLIESTASHSSEALNSFMTALSEGTGEMKYVILKHVLQFNTSKFASPGTRCWDVFSNILLQGVRRDGDPHLPFEIVNEASLTIMETVTTTRESDEDSIDATLSMVIGSVEGLMKGTPVSVQISTIQHLNTLIDKFGAWMTSGWETVLEIISGISSTKVLGLMRPAFHTLELICSDFLERLPYKCVFNLTICLDEFSRQTSDLNISFTSTSLFWSVCDHLMAGHDIGEIDPSVIGTENELIEVARDDKSSSKRSALWLLAVTRLAYVAKTAVQQQVRTSAIQIFLRLFNTHGANLTPGAWDIAYKLVFSALVDAAESSQFDDPKDMEETCILVIIGISKISLLFGSQFAEFESVKIFWRQWMRFLDLSTPKSAKIASIAYSNLSEALSSDQSQWLSRKAIGEFWVKQSPFPRFSAEAPKSTADALKELVSLHKFLRQECNTQSALTLITNCALFQYYTTPAPPSAMSSLQLECSKALDAMQDYMDPTMIGMFLLALSQLSLAPYELITSEDTQDGTTAKPRGNFAALSEWALSKLLSVIEDPEIENDSFRQCALEVAPVILDRMNKLSSSSSNQIDPSRVILKLMKLSSSVEEYDGNKIIESLRLVLTSANDIGSSQLSKQNESDVIEHMELFVEMLKSRNLPRAQWDELLYSLLKNSVLYERSIHNVKFYEQDSSGLESALEYGTVDTPKQIHSKCLAFHCLGFLRRLGVDQKPYSQRSSQYFNARARAVLCQYMGECSLLGQEPLRTLLHEELVLVLEELKNCTSSRVHLQDRTHELLLRTLTNAHREILPLLQELLRN